MGVFKSEAEAKAAFDKLFEAILELEEPNKRASDANVVLALRYSDPSYFGAIDGTKSPAVLSHDPDIKADIEISMSSDTAHTFWKGELNFPVALMKGKVKIKGSAATVMRLLPTVTPGYQIYPRLIQELGIE